MDAGGKTQTHATCTPNRKKIQMIWQGLLDTSSIIAIFFTVFNLISVRKMLGFLSLNGLHETTILLATKKRVLGSFYELHY